MANKYFINLPEKTEVNNSDIVVVEDAEDTKRITFANLLKPMNFNASGSGVAIGKDSERNAFEVALPAEFSPDFTMPNGRKAVYLENTSDANDVVEEWVLGSDGSNYPQGGGYWYVNTIMYGDSSQRKQIAYGYRNNDVFTRYFYGGTWSTWDKTGMPDRGSNTNGTYIKFSDGTMITYSSVSYTVPTDHVSPSSGVLTFPALFASPPTVSVSGRRTHAFSFADPSIGGSMGQYPSTTSYAIQWIELSAQLTFTAGSILSAMVIAIGRWK